MIIACTNNNHRLKKVYEYSHFNGFNTGEQIMAHYKKLKAYYKRAFNKKLALYRVSDDEDYFYRIIQIGGILWQN